LYVEPFAARELLLTLPALEVDAEIVFGLNVEVVDGLNFEEGRLAF
jgi:hypothetical protein